MPVSYIFKMLLIKSLAKNPERNLKIILIRKEMLFRTDNYLREKMKGRSKLSVFKMEGILHSRLGAAECGMKSEVTACVPIIKWLRVS